MSRGEGEIDGIKREGGRETWLRGLERGMVNKYGDNKYSMKWDRGKAEERHKEGQKKT